MDSKITLAHSMYECILNQNVERFKKKLEKIDIPLFDNYAAKNVIKKDNANKIIKNQPKFELSLVYYWDISKCIIDEPDTLRLVLPFDVETLLQINDSDPNELIPNKGMSILHLAVGIDPVSSSEEITKLILQYGGDPNRCSEDGLTSIHIAAAWGRLEIIKLLLEYGGNQFLEDFEGKTALDYAAENGYTDVASFLIENSNQCYGECDSPDKFSFKLEKIIVKNDYIEGEYFPQNDCEIESKSEKVNDWLEKNSFDLSLYSAKSKQSDASDRRLSSNYDTCLSMTSQGSKSSPKECKNITEPLDNSHKALQIGVIEKNNATDYSDELIISGVESIAFSKTEENDKYSVFLKQSSEGNRSEDITKMRTFVSYVFPDSPAASPHRNYNSRSNVSVRKNYSTNHELRNELSENSSDFSDTSLDLNADCSSVSSVVSSEFNKALITTSNSNMTERFSTNDNKENMRDSRKICCIKTDNSIDKVSDVEDAALISDRRTSFMSSKISMPMVNDTLLSVAEEYKYEDEQAGVALVEKRILVTPVPVNVDCPNSSTGLSVASSVSTLPQSLSYDTDTLRKELKSCGIHPGPITSTTKLVYLKRLTKLRKAPIIVSGLQNSKQKTYSIELEKTFRDPNWSTDLSTYIPLERKIVEQFEEPDPNKRWREGIVKSSFTYLLLDPRITDNLPCKADSISKSDAWRKFVDSIFYVGKGKRSRPYSHLYQAVSLYNRGQFKSDDKKLQNIFDIWNNNTGVVCLHIFQNVIPVEAYTREAAMIEVLGLKNLRNVKPGNYYGVVSTWPLKQKKLLGVYLLYRAMLIFLNEGERQLRPADIG